MRLTGKIALITGSSLGIGRAIAERFAHEGADVVINYNRTPGGAEEALHHVESSVHGELPFPNFAAYCASKGDLNMLTRNLSVELGQFGITIHSIAPGAVETPLNTKLLNDSQKLGALLTQIPLARLGKPNDVAGLATFLASAEADYVTGSTYVVDGGPTWHYQEQ